MNTILKSYSSIILLLMGITIGSLVGLFVPDLVLYIKPIGDIFLNLLFVAVIPLLFFAISTAIANIESNSQLGKILGVMSAVFISTIAIAAVLTILGLWAFPVTAITESNAASELISTNAEDTWGDKIVRFLSVGEFVHLLSRQNILAFVIVSFFLGSAVRKSGDGAGRCLQFLIAGNEVMKNLVTLSMPLGPVRVGAYSGCQGEPLGREL